MSRTPARPPIFDSEALYRRLDERRRTLRVSWRTVLQDAGVHSVGVVTRLALDGGTPSVDNLARLLVWLGDTDIAAYIKAQP
jgi:hypothetical protein